MLCPAEKIPYPVLDPPLPFYAQVPAGKKRYVVVSGYAQDSRSDKPGMKPAGDVDARPECVAEKTRGTSPSPEVKTLPKKPKKGLFNPVFGSSKALSKVGEAVQRW